MRPWYACAIGFGVAACGSSTAPAAGGISFVGGNQQADTVQAAPTQALVVRVRQSDGAPAVNQVVQFQAIATGSGPLSTDWVYPEPLTSPSAVALVTDTTNALGQAVVNLVFGERAGAGVLLVTVPALGYVDTARFTVTAGAASGMRADPTDTAAYLNAPIALHSVVVDRFGNPRTDPVTYAVASGPATLSGSTLAVTAFARVTVIAAAGGRRDTSYVTGVPPGTMGASRDAGGIDVFNLDGSGYQTITSRPAGTVAWAPSGTSLVFDETQNNGTRGGSDSLSSVTVSTGAVSVLDTTGGPIDAWPAYSRDGTWIYYVKLGNYGNLWRVHPDGSADAIVPSQSGIDAEFPSPSPDDSQIAYVVRFSQVIEILNLSTGVSTQLGTLFAQSVAWSPISNQLAYVTGPGGIDLINSDGSGQSTLTTAAYFPQIGWSPDGKWIIARNATTYRIDLLSVTTPNVVLSLGYTGAVGSPTWH
jgi:hypothetical protein